MVGLGECSYSAINPLGDVALGVIQQQAGVVDICDLKRCLGANVAVLGLADSVGHYLVTCSDCIFNRLFPGVVPAMT